MEEYKCLSKFNKVRENKPKKNLFIKLINICLFTAIIFVINLILCKSNSDYKEFIYKNVYNHNLSFSKIDSVINKYLGDVVPSVNTIPSLNNNVQEVFNEKLVYNSLEELDEGVKLNINMNGPITSFESGIVVFNGIKDNLGNTLILEQIDGNEAWYINIDTSGIDIYDYIEKGNIIGNCLTDNVTIYFKNKGEIVDYKKYIS